jgi:hypothetical protein
MTEPFAQTPSSATPENAGAQRRPFAEEVRGQQGRPIDLTMARLMDDLYDETYGRPSGKTIDGFTRLSDDQLRKVGIDPAMLEDSKSGFKARFYGDAEGRVVLAYSGTDEGKDWWTNFGQGLGFDTAQYNQAMALARMAKVAYGDDLAITGHSLGGGLAAAAALAADVPAVTFNAAGVNDRTLSRIGLDPDAAREEAENGLIRRYAVRNEILTDLQERTPIMRSLMPDAPGHKIELADPDPLSFWQKLNPVKSVKHGVEIHYIDAVIKAMERASGDRSVSDRTLMSEPEHPLHREYARSLGQMAAAEQAVGKGFDARTQNVAGVLALESHRQGVVPDRVLFGDQGRIFAVQGDRPELQRVIHADPSAATVPLIETSRQALHLLAQTGQQGPVDPAPEAAVARGR